MLIYNLLKMNHRHMTSYWRLTLLIVVSTVYHTRTEVIKDQRWKSPALLLLSPRDLCDGYPGTLQAALATIFAINLVDLLENVFRL